jgi:DNA-directed RNA polymerase I, II, and III subunit RPABC2
MGAPTMVQVGAGEIDALEIARRELRDGGKIPIIIRRYLPNGDYEDWLVLIDADEIMLS